MTYMARGMSYKKFRESQAQYYTSNEGKMTRTQVIKKLESFIVQTHEEGQNFFNKYEIQEEQ